MCEYFKEAYKVLTSHEELKHVRNDAFKRDWDDNKVLLSVDDEAKVRGVLTYKIYKVNNHRAYGSKGDIQLKQVAVSKNHLGEGISVLLMNLLLDKAKEHNCHNICLAVRETNKRARYVYEKFGFVEDRKIMWSQQGKELPGIIYKYEIKNEDRKY